MYLCGLEVHFAEICSSSKIETNNYGLLLDAFLSLLEMHLDIVCVQAIGLWGATGCIFLALENAFATFPCPNYGLLLDAFLSLLEMHLEIVCVQAIGLCENAFGMFLC